MTDPLYSDSTNYDNGRFDAGQASPRNEGGTPGQGQNVAHSDAHTYPNPAAGNVPNDGVTLGQGSVQYPSVPVIGDSDE
jgi:hypothetical protein